MIVTNTKIIIHPQNKVDDLKAVVSTLENRVAGYLGNKKAKFKFRSKPFPHFIVPEEVDFMLMKRHRNRI